MVFNNDNINHSLSKLENISKDKDLDRKIIVFMLVNPQNTNYEHVEADNNVKKERKNDINIDADGYDVKVNII